MKRILFIILAALVATTAVQARKMSDLTVVIDPGHGGYRGCGGAGAAGYLKRSTGTDPI